MEKRWRISKPNSQVVDTLAKALGYHKAVATVMANRNITSLEDAKKFLSPSVADLGSLSLLKDMDKAVKRIMRAIFNNEKILILGDYDADGVCATALLMEFLSEAGASVSYHIPHRMDEGYGFSEAHVFGPVKAHGAGLVVTVDNGISSHAAVRAAKDAGVDVIVTDHHTPPDIIPDAVAVLDPKLSECGSGLSHLAGVGVAFCLCVCLRQAIREQGLWPDGQEPNLKHKCDLVALGTVADMVPLIKENRILTCTGLEILRSGRRVGLHALMEVSALEPENVDAHNIAFRLAPRLNAAGRVDHAGIAVELLLAKNGAQARKLASQLDDLNRKRQRMSEELYGSVLSLLRADKELKGERSLVLARPGWHPGVIGIAAARLVREFNCPVVLISVEDDVGKGSARSVFGLDLYNALCGCAHCLEVFGGHAQAAGLTIKAAGIDEFRNIFDQQVMENTVPEDFTPILTIDSAVPLADVGPELADQIESMAPFGIGNPEPVFMSTNVSVRPGAVVGGRHRRMALFQKSSGNQINVNAIWFNAGDRLIPSITDQVAFKVQWNKWKDRKTVQAIVEDLRDL